MKYLSVRMLTIKKRKKRGGGGGGEVKRDFSDAVYGGAAGAGSPGRVHITPGRTNFARYGIVTISARFGPPPVKTAAIVAKINRPAVMNYVSAGTPRNRWANIAAADTAAATAKHETGAPPSGPGTTDKKNDFISNITSTVAR